MESRKTATSRRVPSLGFVRSAGTARPRHGAVLPAPARAANDSAARASVITVRITGQEWNWKTPWSKQGPWARTVTGLVVEGPAVLVATPSLGNHLLLEVQKRGEDLRTPARLVLSDPEGPLALLAVDDAAFWKGLAPLPIAESIVPEGEVTVNRWVRSGQFESSRATLRQVRASRHGLSRTSVLTLEASSSLDGAGDSEVLVKDGSVVGLATSKQGETLAAISAPVLRQFLADARNPPYRGFARAGIAWQDLTNPALRSYLGLVENEAGVRLTRVLPHGSGAGVLEPGDVVLEVAGHKIDPTGNFEHPVYGRLLFPVLFTDGARPGDSLRVKILRQGERREVDDAPPADGGGRRQGATLRARPRPRLRGLGGPRLPGAHRALPRHLGRLGSARPDPAARGLRPRGGGADRRRPRASSSCRASSPIRATSATRTCAT